MIVIHDIYALSLFHGTLNPSYRSSDFSVRERKVSPADKENDLKTKLTMPELSLQTVSPMLLPLNYTCCLPSGNSNDYVDSIMPSESCIA